MRVSMPGGFGVQGSSGSELKVAWPRSGAEYMPIGAVLAEVRGLWVCSGSSCAAACCGACGGTTELRGLKRSRRRRERLEEEELPKDAGSLLDCAEWLEKFFDREHCKGLLPSEGLITRSVAWAWMV
jgi:hypothetical protein